MRRFLLVGTDTDIGKTTASAALCAALLRDGLHVAACKPVETGSAEHSDLVALRAVVGADERLTLVDGLRFELAAAPSAAARAAGIPAPTVERCAAIVRAAEAGTDAVVVETCGGALTPLSASAYVCDVARALPEYRIVLVAGLRLGVLSHSFAIAEYLRSIGRPCTDAIVCDRFGPSPAWYVDSTREDMEARGLHVAAFIPHGIQADAGRLAAIAGPLAARGAA